MKLKKLLALSLCVCMLLNTAPTVFAGILSTGSPSEPSVQAADIENTSGGILSTNNQEDESYLSGSNAGILVSGSSQDGESNAGILVSGNSQDGESNAGILVSGNSQDGESNAGILVSGNSQDGESSTGILVPGNSQNDESQLPVDEPITQCEFCGYFDGAHADDCSTIHAEEEETKNEPLSSKKSAPMVSNTYQDIYDEMMAAENLDDYNSALNELDEDQQAELFSMLSKDEKDALSEQEDTLYFEAITTPQASFSLMSTATRVEAYESVIAIAAKEEVSLPECTCGWVGAAYYHAATCPCFPASLTNEQAWLVWQELSDFEKQSARYWFTSEQMEYIEEMEALADLNEVTDTVAGCEVSVFGNLPENASLTLAEAEIDPVEFGIDDESLIYAVLDIKVLQEDNSEWQPVEGESVIITMDAASLGMEDGDEFVIYHQHSDEISVSDSYIVEDGLLTFVSDGFSIYVVTGGTGDNHYNYKIFMSVGDTLELTSTNTNWTGTWSLSSGDTDKFSLSTTSGSTTRITARGEGSVIVKYRTETIEVIACPRAGSSISNDIIFANVRKNINTNDDEYTNTYGPYTMKIRFEDTNGALLNMGEDYYVFDSECVIDVNTFSAAAPNGYTYAGAFFYWTGHDGYNGAKVHVTSIIREDELNYGSYLWYAGTHDSSGSGSWAFQASGVLHVVYAPVSEVHTVIFKDHDNYELANYALQHNDRGVTFPAGYVDNIDNMANTLINVHHDNLTETWEFNGNWLVTGGGSGIDGTYTTAQLKSVITRWNITSNITITAQCEISVADLTIKKSGCNVSLDPGQTFIFNIEGVDDKTSEINLTVVIVENFSVTIKDLPVGTYKITENTDWSWRYTPDTNKQGKTFIVEAGEDNELTFDNDRDGIYWFDSSTYRDNVFN